MTNFDFAYFRRLALKSVEQRIDARVARDRVELETQARAILAVGGRPALEVTLGLGAIRVVDDASSVRRSTPPIGLQAIEARKTEARKTLLEFCREADPGGGASEVLGLLAERNPILEPTPSPARRRTGWERFRRWLACRTWSMAQRLEDLSEAIEP